MPDGNPERFSRRWVDQQLDRHACHKIIAYFNNFQSILSTMSADEPYVWLPGLIELNGDEALAVLYALDVAIARARSAHEERVAEAAKLLITRKLWDELADILEMNGDHDG